MANEENKTLMLSRHGISGIVLLPLLAWFLVSFFYIMSDPIGYLPVFFYYPVNAIFGIFFSVIILYHLDFDVKYVIEHSSIKSQNLKNILMLFFDFLSIIIAVSTVLSILQLHFMGIFIA